MKLVVVRHGRTEANAEGRLLGHLDVPLDDVGLAQADRLADAVGPIDRVITSPLRRARQTASAIPAPIEVDDRWIELDYGELDGVPLADVPEEQWARWRADVSVAPAAGESLATLGQRVRSALDDLVAEADRGSTVAIVTHVSPIKAAVAWALGVGDEIAWRLFVAPASITRIDVTPHGPVVRSFNERAHLADGAAG